MPEYRLPREKAARIAVTGAALFALRLAYAVLLWALTLAHRARCAAAIFFRDAADIVRLFGMVTMFCFPPLILAQRALWAAAILFLPAADNCLLTTLRWDTLPNAARAPLIVLSS